MLLHSGKFSLIVQHSSNVNASSPLTTNNGFKMVSFFFFVVRSPFCNVLYQGDIKQRQVGRSEWKSNDHKTRNETIGECPS